MITIENTQFGTVQVEEDKMITMPSGIPGFPGKKRFVILEREDTQPFYLYQCVDDPALSFVIMNPYLFKPDYSVNLKPVRKEMAWNRNGAEQIKVYVIVNTSGGGPNKMTANLIGPLVINTGRREALQIVIPNSPYSHRHPVFQPSSR